MTGRKLEWLYQHCKGDIQTLYTKPKYTFQVNIFHLILNEKNHYLFIKVSTYQMTILLLFNEFHIITVERIFKKTQIESELFIQVLCSLLKTKVLICSQINVDESGDNFNEKYIKMDHIIEVNENYQRFKMNLQITLILILFVFSKKVKLNLNTPIKSVEQKESEIVNQSIDEDRKFVTQVNYNKYIFLKLFNNF